MKVLTLPIFFLLIAACGGGGTKVEIQKTEVLPDTRTLTENKAISMLRVSEDTERTAAIIGRDQSPNFSWKDFWEGLQTENVLKNAGPRKVKHILALANKSCKAQDLEAFTRFAISNLETSLDKENDLLFIHRVVTVHPHCNAAPTFTANTKLLQILKDRIVDATGLNKEELLKLMEEFTSFLKNQLTPYTLSELAQSFNVTDWAKLTRSVVQVNNTGDIKRLISIAKNLHERPENIERELISKVLSSSVSMENILTSFGKRETLSLLAQYSRVTYPSRDLISDLKAITRAPFASAEIGFNELLDIKKLINEAADDKNFPQSMVLFNKAVKSYELFLLNDKGDGQKFISYASDSDLLARWIHERISGAKKRRVPTPTSGEGLLPESGRVEEILFARTTAYLSSEKERPQALKEYCEILQDNGIKNIVLTKAEELKELKNVGGCVHFSPDKRITLELQDDAIFDDDLVLTLKNTDIFVKADRLDMNFLDLSTTLKHSDIKAPVSAIELDAIVLPMFLGLNYKSQLDDEEKTYWFLYYYQLQEAQPGNYFFTWKPAEGHPGGSLRLNLKSQGNSFLPSFFSLGGEGQKAASGRQGGRKAHYSLFPNFYHFRELDQRTNVILKYPMNSELLEEILLSKNWEDHEIQFIDPLPHIDIEKETLRRTLRNIAWKSSRCYNPINNDCFPRELKYIALLDLKAKLLHNKANNVIQLPNLFNIFIAFEGPEGPIPEPAPAGKPGTIQFVSN